MPDELEDSDVLNKVNTLLNNETGEEKNPRSDDAEKAKILTILDDPKEVKKRRQKELNSQKEMGVMRAVKRSEAAGKRMIQTRWVDRKEDGSVKSRLVLKDFNRDQGRTQPEMFASTPSTPSLKTMLAASSRDRNSHPELDNIAIAIGEHTAFLHADIDQELCAEPPEESELCEDEVWKLQIASYGYRKAPKLWRQTCGKSPGKSELPSTPDRSELFQK